MVKVFETHGHPQLQIAGTLMQQFSHYGIYFWTENLIQNEVIFKFVCNKYY